jgi:hypothetical protein
MPKWVLNLVEFIGLSLVTAGVAVWSIPSALIVAGVSIVAACEVRG